MIRPPLRILVCGGRTYCDWEKIRSTLDDLAIIHGIAHLRHGAAAGADSFANQWADLRRVPKKAFPANWNLHGRGAGPIRNQEMLDWGQ